MDLFKETLEMANKVEQRARRELDRGEKDFFNYLQENLARNFIERNENSLEKREVEDTYVSF